MKIKKYINQSSGKVANENSLYVKCIKAIVQMFKYSFVQKNSTIEHLIIE